MGNMKRNMDAVQNCLKKLNLLQSNSAFLMQKNDPRCKFEKGQVFLERSGMTLKALDGLSVIHITGTKGKGSTCFYCESMLRELGFKTGMYTSPHLRQVNERIRLNGEIIDDQKFAKYFENVFERLAALKVDEEDMPNYFQFLTILAFNVFVSENVDVAIVEVGIGGEYDTTNMIRNTDVVGIASLALEHTATLGDTIEEIAWQKAGIMKQNCLAFTVPQSHQKALDILKERSVEKRCTLHVVPPFEKLVNAHTNSNISIQIDYDVQKCNIALAAQLVKAWCWRHQTKKKIPSNKYQVNSLLPQQYITGIERCNIPGRGQILQFSDNTFYLDVAHTAKSLHFCVDWYANKLTREWKNVSESVLLFNVIGDRNAFALLNELLQRHRFDRICLTANISFVENSHDYVLDQFDAIHSRDRQMEMLKDLKQRIFMKYGYNDNNCGVFGDVESAVNSFCGDVRNHVLITGSCRLVGAALIYLDGNNNANKIC